MSSRSGAGVPVERRFDAVCDGGLERPVHHAPFGSCALPTFSGSPFFRDLERRKALFPPERVTHAGLAVRRLFSTKPRCSAAPPPGPAPRCRDDLGRHRGQRCHRHRITFTLLSNAWSPRSSGLERGGLTDATKDACEVAAFFSCAAIRHSSLPTGVPRMVSRTWAPCRALPVLLAPGHGTCAIGPEPVGEVLAHRHRHRVRDPLANASSSNSIAADLHWRYTPRPWRSFASSAWRGRSSWVV